MEHERGIIIASALTNGESDRGSAGAAVVEMDGEVRFMLIDEIDEQYRERVEDALEEHKPGFVVVEKESNRVLVLDRKTVISIASSVESLKMGGMPIWDILLTTSAVEVSESSAY